MTFVNISDHYGDPVIATIEDYQELSPDHDFSITYRSGNTIIVRDDGLVVAIAIEDMSPDELRDEFGDSTFEYLMNHLS